MGGGGGAPFPWGRRHWVGINFCHPEVVKLQQQYYMQNTIFDPPPPPPPLNWFYSFSSGRGRVTVYPGDSNRRIGRKNENDNPVRKWYICSSIITLIFGFCKTLDRHSGFRHVPGETGTTLQEGCFYVVVSQGNSGNKVEKWQFLDLKSNNCVEFSVFNVFN